MPHRTKETCNPVIVTIFGLPEYYYRLFYYLCID